MKNVLHSLLIAVALVLALFAAPQTTLTLLAVAGLCAGAVYIVANQKRSVRRRGLTNAVNTLPANVGTSTNSRRFRAAAAQATPWLLGKTGADAEHIALVAAASDEPIAAYTDGVAAAEDPIDGELLGLTNRTLPLVAAAAIGVGVDVYSDGTGKVTIKPTAAGTYWRVGSSRTAAGADNDPVEVLTIKPRKLIVIAALTSTDGTAAGASASLANLAAEAEKIGDDVRAIAAALNGNADVALATT